MEEKRERERQKTNQRSDNIHAFVPYESLVAQDGVWVVQTNTSTSTADRGRLYHIRVVSNSYDIYGHAVTTNPIPWLRALSSLLLRIFAKFSIEQPHTYVQLWWWKNSSKIAHYMYFKTTLWFFIFPWKSLNIGHFLTLMRKMLFKNL